MVMIVAPENCSAWRGESPGGLVKLALHGHVTKWSSVQCYMQCYSWSVI